MLSLAGQIGRVLAGQWLRPRDPLEPKDRSGVCLHRLAHAPQLIGPAGGIGTKRRSDSGRVQPGCLAGWMQLALNSVRAKLRWLQAAERFVRAGTPGGSGGALSALSTMPWLETSDVA
jgi:hypothetical protein